MAIFSEPVKCFSSDIAEIALIYPLLSSFANCHTRLVLGNENFPIQRLALVSVQFAIVLPLYVFDGINQLSSSGGKWWKWSRLRDVKSAYTFAWLALLCDSIKCMNPSESPLLIVASWGGWWNNQFCQNGWRKKIKWRLDWEGSLRESFLKNELRKWFMNVKGDYRYVLYCRVSGLIPPNCVHCRRLIDFLCQQTIKVHFCASQNTVILYALFFQIQRLLLLPLEGR